MRVLLFLFLCFWLNILPAQQVIITSEGIDKDGFGDARVIGQDDEGFYVLQSNLSLNTDVKRIGFVSRKLRVSYFDGVLRPKWTIPVATDIDNGVVDQVIYSFDKLLFICSSESKNESSIQAWVRQIDNHGLGGAPGKKVAAFSFKRSSTNEKVKFFASENQQFAMVLFKENLDDGMQVLHVAVLDSVLDLISNRSFTIPFSTKELTIQDYKISNEGAIAFLGFMEKKSKNKELNKSKISEFHLYTVLPKSDQVSDNFLKVNDKSLTQAGLAINNHNNEAVVMGFYSDLLASHAAGIFCTKLPFTHKPDLEIKTNPLSGGQHEYVSGDRNNSNNTDISTHPIQKIILRNDGGAVIMAEAAYSSEYFYYDYFTQSVVRHTDYHFDNVFLVSVNKDCSVDWNYVIYKHQESSDDDGIFSSYCPLVNSDNIIVVYNRDIDRNQVARASLITNKGEQRDIDISKTTDHLMLLPTWGKQISEDEIIVPVYQKKKLFLSKITF